ncbi:MAG: hypothetical protein ACRC62_31690, partial [Microcoleus sp.]
MLLLKDYLNNKDKKGGNLTVHTPFLWSQLAEIRGCVPSMQYKARWKYLAGCSKLKKGKSGETPQAIVDGRHYLTPREAASVVMLALWDSEVRELVDPELGSEAIEAHQVEELFDRWMREKVSDKAKA